MWPAASDQLIFSITVYPPADSDKQPIVGGTYREDSIPEWVRTALDMLDMAAIQGQAVIPFFGSKSDNTYWFFAQQVYEAGKEL